MSPRKMRLADLRRLSDDDPDFDYGKVTFDVTPGLHDWINGLLDKAQAAAEIGSVEDRWCAAHRKILEAHPYTSEVVSPIYRAKGADFGCITCHVTADEYGGTDTEGRGNCPTILALAEGYGLDDEETDDA
ncbi:hypothetical protein EES43_24720 [Streptomyces sp. ADI96-02]|uniref:hypothetical protein n=1 Tax=Streptomyces sp. ADI96-02 TaxID=1522760 RepID=UPI000F54CE65|nr:hypothetical protein [Streptomyces sp. ADI96-02]RPK56250.1 hypothetical protein EES43_24720 [Streptomyces sp. ADI96-02]